MQGENTLEDCVEDGTNRSSDSFNVCEVDVREGGREGERSAYQEMPISSLVARTR